MVDNAALFARKIFLYVIAELKGCLLNTLFENAESFVTLQLPSDCSVVSFRTKKSEKQKTTIFCTNRPKRRKAPYMEISRDNDRNGKNFFNKKCYPLMVKKEAYKSNTLQLQNPSLGLIVKKYSLFSATSVLINSGLTTLLPPWKR